MYIRNWSKPLNRRRGSLITSAALLLLAAPIVAIHGASHAAIDPTATVPTGLTAQATVTNQDAVLSWNPVAEAVSYDIIRNGGFRASTTDTAFTDTGGARDGYIYEYQVRTVLANGDVSGNSQAVSVSYDLAAPSLQWGTNRPDGSHLDWSKYPMPHYSDPAGPDVTVSVQAMDSPSGGYVSGVAAVHYSIDGGPVQTMQYNAATDKWGATIQSTLPIGEHIMRVSVTDALGNGSANPWENGSPERIVSYNANGDVLRGTVKFAPYPVESGGGLPSGVDNPAGANAVLTFDRVNTSPNANNFGTITMTHRPQPGVNEFSITNAAVGWMFATPDGNSATLLARGNVVQTQNGTTNTLANQYAWIKLSKLPDGTERVDDVRLTGGGQWPAARYTWFNGVIDSSSNWRIRVR